MEFVNHNIIIEIRRGDLSKFFGVKGLDRYKQMVKTIGPETTDHHRAEVQIFEDSSKTS